VAYGVLGDLPGTARLVVARWDAPVSGDQTRRTFTVQRGQSASEIADHLNAQELIRSPIVFRVLVEARDVGGRIEAGEYQLTAAMSTNEVVTVLSRGATRGLTVTIPEGWRAEQAAQKVETLGLGSAADFVALVRTPSGITLPPDLVPPGQALEGYLFPDTYEVEREPNVRRLVEMMVRQADRKLTPQLREKSAAQGLTLHQAITLASIIEREAARPAEQPTIASVYLNRLRANMPLQADPTVQFAVASLDLAEALGFNFWKRELTRADLQLASPYNTYVQRGLPPGPICSPGLSALEAVAEPAQTDYLYFVARGDGSHAFARTGEEHQSNIERYQRSAN
jgi:UPF0755 protein